MLCVGADCVRDFVIPAYAYRDVGSRATQDAKAEAGIQGFIILNRYRDAGC